MSDTVVLDVTRRPVRADRVVATPPDPDVNRTPGRWSRWVLVGLTTLGALVRAHGFTSGGLWRDDAWVALSARVGLRTASHMWVSAPGYGFLQREWILLGPSATWWAQLFPFLLGVAAVPSIYWLVRRFDGSPTLALGLAAVVALGDPVAVMYSTHLKEYSCDLLLTVALLGKAESIRRRPTVRGFRLLALLSVVAFTLSASSAPVVAAVWAALLLCSMRGSTRPMQVLRSGGLAAAGCVAVAWCFYRHISPAETRFWQGYFLDLHSPGTFISSLALAFARLCVHLVALPISGIAVLVVFCAGLVVIWCAGVFRNEAMRAPTLCLLFAAVCSGAHLDPLGPGRTDEYLTPVLIVLTGAGLYRLSITFTSRTSRPVRAAAWAVAGLLLGITGLASFSDAQYPTTDVKALATAIAHSSRPGDHIVVGELMRYPWALYEEPRLNLIFGPDWATGFSVVSTKADTFIAPSEYYEGGSDPAVWAAAQRHDSRIWFVYSPPLSLNPLYAALRDDGWKVTRAIQRAGCQALLLTPTPSRPLAGG